MGIDARILVRNVPRSQVSDAWLIELSWRLCEAIGAEHFWFTDSPLTPEEADRAKDAWHTAFQAHPRYPELQAEQERGRTGPFGFQSDEQRSVVNEIRDAIRADIGPVPPDARRLVIEPTMTHYREAGDPLPGLLYQQDGPDVVADVGECLLRVSLAGRYYGVGYERGDLLTYCAVAEWLEVNVPDCQVWYGGDSSGVLARPFDYVRRVELKRHLYGDEGRSYFRFGGMTTLREDEVNTPPACSLCPGNEYRGTRCGWGPSYALFSCPGCGKSVESRDGGATYAKRVEKD